MKNPSGNSRDVDNDSGVTKVAKKPDEWREDSKLIIIFPLSTSLFINLYLSLNILYDKVLKETYEKPI